jgi:hypothetical protein
MARSRSIFALTLILTSLVAASAAAGEPFRYPQARAGKGELKYVSGVPVLVVEGTPDQIGQQVGVLAVKPAARLLSYPKDFLKAFGLELTWPLFVRAGQELLKQFPPDHLREMEALIKAAETDRDTVVAANTMFDIKKFIACSALIVEPERSATGGTLMGRNLDYPSLGYIQEYSLVTVYRPAGKHAFVSIGFPGVVGCLSGMNDAGLSVAVLEVFAVRDGTERYDIAGTPYALCYRRILEECATVDAAEKLLKSMRRITTTNLAVCDKQGGAVFEVTPRHVIRRRAEQSVCPCTNHFLTGDLKPAKQPNWYHTMERYQALERICRKKAKLDLDDIHQALDDANQGRATLQTMVFEPAKLRLYLGIGKCPSSALPLQRLDLAPLLHGDVAMK